MLSLQGLLRVTAQVNLESVEMINQTIKAAEQGNAEAEYALARCYRDGNGVEKDENTAMGWLRSAARHGHRFAKIALRYKTGR